MLQPLSKGGSATASLSATNTIGAVKLRRLWTLGEL